MQYYKRILTLFMLVCCQHIYAQNITPSSVGNALVKAFESKQASDLVPVLSDDFSVGVYTGKSAEANLQRVLKNFKVDSLSFGTVRDSSGKHYLPITFYQPGKENLKSRAWLNGNNQLQYVDIFDHFYKLDRYEVSRLVKSIPFELKDGSIILTARVNQYKRPLRFLFDTGADGMALTKSLADSIGLEVSREQTASVVGGTQDISVSEDNSIFLDSFEIKHQGIAIFDKLGDQYDGIIGNLIARQYIIKVNYDKKRMELYTFGNYKYDKKGTSVSIDFSSGVGLIQGKIKVGDKEAKGNFVFDTGAGYYLIGFGPFVKRNLLLTNGFVPWYTSSTVSMGHVTPTFTDIFDFMELGSLKFQNFPGTLQATSATSGAGSSVDGSLGVRIISRFNFTLNLVDRVLHLTPNKYYSLPMDFMLGRWQMGFNESHQMVAHLFTIPGAEEQDIKAGDIIVAINHISAKVLENDPEKLDKIKKLPFEKLSFTLLRDGKEMVVEHL